MSSIQGWIILRCRWKFVSHRSLKTVMRLIHSLIVTWEWWESSFKGFFLWMCFTCILVLVGESLMRCERSVILCSQEHFSSSFETILGSNDVPRHSLYLLSVISVYDDITGHLSLESSTSKHPIIEMYAPKPPKPVLAAASSFYNQTMIGF